jgi:SAM-dependent methyltransferase
MRTDLDLASIQARASAWVAASASCDAFIDPMVPRFIRHLEALGLRSGRLLDAGCGFGHNAHAFSRIGFDVTGIDGSRERIAAARATYPTLQWQQADLEQRLPFEDDSFDVVFSCSVLQYLDRRVLDEYQRILRRGGAIVLIENLKNNPISRLGRKILWTTGYKFQSYAKGYFSFDEARALQSRFGTPRIHFFHVLTPLSQPSALRWAYTPLHALDRALLRLPGVVRASWLFLFVARNDK